MVANRPPKKYAIKALTDDDIQQALACRFMILAGFPTHIINIETGASLKKIRALTARLEEDGYPVREQRSKCMRSSRSAIYTIMDSYQASLVMNLYRVIGGDEIFKSINMHALLRAYKVYSATIEHLPRSTPLAVAIRSSKFSLANAWILANELRSGLATFDKCKSCQTAYFFTQLQQVECSCPFCRQYDAHVEKRTKSTRPVMAATIAEVLDPSRVAAE